MELRKIRLYDLRHGHITEPLNDGVPYKQIQERVGHSSATMTKDRYGHFVVGAQEKSIRKWERTRFKKTADFEPGASEGIRTPDPRFTKPLLEILSHLSAIGHISQRLLSCLQEGDLP